MEGRGKNPDSLTIDRIDDRKGYHIDNIRILSHAENSHDNFRNREPGGERETEEAIHDAYEDGTEDCAEVSPGDPF